MKNMSLPKQVRGLKYDIIALSMNAANGGMFILSTEVTFKGTVNGLIIVMNDQDPFEDILDDIENKIRSAPKFFEQGTLSIKYRGRKLSHEEQRQLLKLLLDKSGVVINSFMEETIKSEQNTATEEMLRTRNIINSKAKIFRGTLRSGQVVTYDGSVVVVGDVNPGAKVIASGSVVVIGALRGMVHAGSKGDRNAYVVAFKLQPMQLRIADIITRAPDSVDTNAEVPEIAHINDDQVYIESFYHTVPKD